MNNSKDISVRDIVKQLIKLYKYLLSKWLIIVIAGVVGGLAGLLYAINSKPKYNATVNFVLSSGSSASGSFAGIVNQLGLGGGNSYDNVFNGDNIITLMESRRMIQKTLFRKPQDSTKTLLNSFIEFYKLNDSWSKNASTSHAYPFPDDAAKMTLVQDSLIRIIHRQILGGLLDVSKPDDKLSIYAVTTTSQNPMIAYYLTKYLVEETSVFYIDTKTSVAKRNLDMLQKEADSIRVALGQKITQVGAQTDNTFNLNSAYQVQRSGTLQSQASASALGQAYGQVLQNLELAKIALQKEIPLYQIIDEPTLPLEEDVPGKLTSIIIGGFLAGFVVLFSLVMIRLFRYLIK